MNIYLSKYLPLSIRHALYTSVHSHDHIYTSVADPVADLWWLTRKADLFITNAADNRESGQEIAQANCIELPTILYGANPASFPELNVIGLSYEQKKLIQVMSQFKRQHRKSGFYIAFEGLNSSGKGTQINLLTEFLSRDYDIYSCREPGTNYLGGELRRLLQAQYEETPAAKTEAALLMGQRAQLITTEIAPRLANGQIIIADRSDGTSLSFQGQGRGLGIGRIGMFNRYFVSHINPDMIIYLHAPLADLQSRQHDGKSEDRFEIQADSFHQQCYLGYQQACLRDALHPPYRWYTIDATQPIETIHHQIVNVVTSALAQHQKNR